MGPGLDHIRGGRMIGASLYTEQPPIRYGSSTVEVRYGLGTDNRHEGSPPLRVCDPHL